MSLRTLSVAVLSGWLLTSAVVPVVAESAGQATAVRKVRVTGVVRDESNNITLPGIPVEVAGAATIYTDVDGRFLFELPPGTHEIKVAMDGYETRLVKVDVPAGARIRVTGVQGSTLTVTPVG